MHTYTAQVIWQRAEQLFLDNRYSRKHLIKFDGGVELPGSSSTHVVPIPMSDPAAVDPEEMFIASLSTCHMLWFLSMAVARKYCVDNYIDIAEGIMARNARGIFMVSAVTLRPKVLFSGNNLPTREDIIAMHHEAHEECFIAASVLTEVRCEPIFQIV